MVSIPIVKDEHPAETIEDEGSMQPPVAFSSRQVKAPFESANPLLLGALKDGRLRIIAPITVRLYTEGPSTIAEALELNEYGYGLNPSEAIADLQHAIAELYFTLEEEKNNLGLDLIRVWASLQQKIVRR